MKRKTLWNSVMVIAVCVLVLSGIMVTGNLKGWFDSKDLDIKIHSASYEEASKDHIVSIAAQGKLGYANIERSGVSYSLKEGTKLRNGDIVETLNGSQISLLFGKNEICLNQNSQASIRIDENAEVCIELLRGEAFACVPDKIEMIISNKKITVQNAVISSNAPFGSANIYVFSGNVEVDGKATTAKQTITLLSDSININDLSIKSLNDFNLTNIRKANEFSDGCFTNEQIDDVIAEREKEKQAAINAKLLQESNKQKISAQREQNKKFIEEQVSKNTNQSSKGSSNDNTNSTKQPLLKCTISIVCDTILDNMGDLKPGKDKYVPSNGCILESSTIGFNDGETVFDVLKRACGLADIQLEYSWTPMYNSYYIEGINHLYEFDCGDQSGWMYKVNGWFPNYGCSAYTLKDGDNIVWCYTCKGLGTDVGGSVN